MRVVNNVEMRELEDKACEMGISKLILMENAGRSIFLEIEKIIKEKRLKNPKIFVLSGKGNNGGDGLVTARFLINRGYDVKVALLGKKDDLASECRKNYEILINQSSDVFLDRILRADSERNSYSYEDLSYDFKMSLIEADIVVDALLGTGISKDITGPLKEIIDFVNKNKKFIVSIDIPTGINSDTGVICGAAIKADITVALGCYKLGHFLGNGRDYSGKLVLGDISLPKIFENEGRISLLEEEKIKLLLKKRKINSHKGNYGHTVVLGGSKGMMGAPLLAGLAALRSGSGLVTAIIPEEISLAFQSSFPEMMTYPVKNWSNETERIINFINTKDVLIIGCGFGQEDEKTEFFKNIINTIKIPTVIDADGLNILSQDIDIIKNINVPLVLTPHIGEMARLIKADKNSILSSPHKVASDFASQYNVYVVLKSSLSAIAEPKGNVYLSTYGNPGMATAGSGDVLSGIIGSFIGQGYDIISSLKLALAIHGLAGNIAKEEKGENAIVATDIINNLHKVLKKWEEQ